MTQELDFIAEIGRMVVKYPSDFFNSVAIAQACLESGYGQSELAKEANNLFGYKAKRGEWDGETYLKESPEEIKGAIHIKRSNFRKYNSWEASVKDHAKMLSRSDWYKNYYRKAISAKTPEEQAKALVNTYATDSKYAEKLIDIINYYGLKAYDEFQKGERPMTKLTMQQAAAKLGLKLVVEPLPLTKTFGRINRKQGIVIHQTGAPGVGQNARAMANYQRNMSDPNNPEQKSWNYQVDDTQAIMSFDHDVATWQSSDGNGPGNMAHISIEKCINADGDYNKAFDNLAKLCACICYVEGFNPSAKIKRHYDFAPDKKWCPAQIMNGKNGLTYQVLKDRVNKYLGILNGATVGHNPQGLQATKTVKYTAPELPFKPLKVGDKVTLSKGFLWLDPSKSELLLSKRQKELELTTDIIAEIKDIPDVNNSKIAYRLKKYNSWILEEYLLEPKADWKIVDEENKEDSKKTEKLPDGHFIWNGKEYKIEAVK
ncbi:glucosaminidase domain-containing protein [Ignavigranum ruoffiae]|uniref:glucosaminidase domain-containing protein n=1 Tax=Ignavigranum ruoffiae TaxID=89093 RepID=UPI003AFF8DAB